MLSTEKIPRISPISQMFAGNIHAGVIEVDSIEDDRLGCTLRNALISLETESLRGTCTLSSGDFTNPNIVTFASEITNSTINLIGSALSISNAFTVEVLGSGITINASVSSRVFEVTNTGPLSLNSMTITGGGIYSQGNSSVSLSDCNISASLSGGVISLNNHRHSKNTLHDYYLAEYYDVAHPPT